MNLDGPPFVLFGTAHLLTVGVVLAVAIGLPLWVRRRDDPDLAYRVGLAMAAILAAHEPLRKWLRHQITGEPWTELLPLHLCGAAVFMVVVALVWRSYRVYEVVYFWGLAGTAQAILTPDLPVGFPHPGYLAFYLSHGGIVVGVIYLTVAYRWRPTPGSLLRSLVALLLYAAAVAPLNLWLDTNYLFLRHKPYGASLLDFLGPWPWYLVSLFGLAWVLFGLCYLPFWLADRRRAAARDSGFGEVGRD